MKMKWRNGAWRSRHKYDMKIICPHDWGTDQSSKAPDLVVGSGSGYRGSWQTAIGGVPAGDVITDNLKKWSGDHCCDGALVPGVFFCNRADLAPSEHVQDIVRWIGDARNA